MEPNMPGISDLANPMGGPNEWLQRLAMQREPGEQDLGRFLKETGGKINISPLTEMARRKLMSRLIQMSPRKSEMEAKASAGNDALREAGF